LTLLFHACRQDDDLLRSDGDLVADMISGRYATPVAAEPGEDGSHQQLMSDRRCRLVMDRLILLCDTWRLADITVVTSPDRILTGD